MQRHTRKTSQKMTLIELIIITLIENIDNVAINLLTLKPISIYVKHI